MAQECDFIFFFKSPQNTARRALTWDSTASMSDLGLQRRDLRLSPVGCRPKEGQVVQKTQARCGVVFCCYAQPSLRRCLQNGIWRLETWFDLTRNLTWFNLILWLYKNHAGIWMRFFWLIDLLIARLYFEFLCYDSSLCWHVEYTPRPCAGCGVSHWQQPGELGDIISPHLLLLHREVLHICLKRSFNGREFKLKRQ
jgi:hypothetical protein